MGFEVIIMEFDASNMNMNLPMEEIGINTNESSAINSVNPGSSSNTLNSVVNAIPTSDVSALETQDSMKNDSLNAANNAKPPSNEFVRKLFKILESNWYPDIVRWTEEGDSFVVLDTGKFTTQILPNHFKHSNFASFVRQLNKYDFHKIKRKPNERQKKIYGELSWEFKHPSFKIHFEAGLDNIKRKLSTQKRSDVAVPGNFNRLISEQVSHNTISKDVFNNLRKRVDVLEKELTSSRNETLNAKVETQKLNSKYNTLVESLITFKTVNENLVNNFNILCSNLVDRGIDLPRSIYEVGALNKKHTFSPLLTKHDNTLSPNQQHNKSPTENDNSILQEHPRMTNDPLSMIPSPTNNELLIRLTDDANNNNQSSNNNSNSSISNNNNHNSGDPNSRASTAVKSENSSDSVAKLPTLRKGFHVLLVEDDSISIQLCSKFLRKYGCTVQVVTDGLSAISTLEKFRYDLVLMDIVMPNLDGATATSIIRNFDNQTPIIAMTGNIEDQDLITYLQHGMNDILAKPFTRDDLHSMLIRYLKDRVPLCEQRKDMPTETPKSNTSPNGNPNPSLPPSTIPQQSNLGNIESPDATSMQHQNTQQNKTPVLANSTYPVDSEHITKKQRI